MVGGPAHINLGNGGLGSWLWEVEGLVGLHKKGSVKFTLVRARLRGGYGKQGAVHDTWEGVRVGKKGGTHRHSKMMCLGEAIVIDTRWRALGVAP